MMRAVYMYFMYVICFNLGMISLNTSYELKKYRHDKELVVTDAFVAIFADNDTDETLKLAFQYSDLIVIKFGAGGVLKGMINTLNYLKQHPEKKIIIDGPCYSACTLLLSSPNVKFTSKTDFYFHAAYKKHDGKIFIDVESTKAYLDLMPFSIQVWISRNKAVESTKFKKFDFKLMKHYFPDMIISSEEIPVFKEYVLVSYSDMDVRKVR